MRDLIFNSTFPNNFSLRYIGKFKNDVEVEFGIFFAKMSRYGLIELPDTLSEARVEPVLD